MRERRTLFMVLVLALALVLGLGWSARAGVQAANQANALEADAGTAFTYQGYLESGGDAVSGTCDFRFILYTAELGGSQVGPLQTLPGVEVNNGVFTVDLDFGAGAFIGEARWLEIAVRCAGDAGYTTLGRQQLTATPHALSAPWSGLSGVPEGFADGIDNEATVVEGTQIYAGEGLTRLTGTESVTLSVASPYRLPQACAGGQIAEWNGSAWACGDDDVGAGGGEGDITAVYAGNGLNGGGATGAVTLTVDFVGNGTAETVARSDHDHDAAYVDEGQPGSISTAMLEDGATLGEILDDDGAGSDLDADRLDGQHGAFYRNADNINAGTLGAGRYSAHADLSAEGYLGNASGDLAQNNGARQVNLNADRLDGQHASDFAGASHGHWGETWSGTGVGLTIENPGVHTVMLPGLLAAVFGDSGLLAGVWGSSDSNIGVYGDSISAAGVHGKSTNSFGVIAEGGGDLSYDDGVGDLKLVGGAAEIYAPDGSMDLYSAANIFFDLDDDNNGSGYLRVFSGANVMVLDLDESGNLNINGSLSKSGGGFKIDHPQDPENKYLYHSFVESPDMMNVYNGNAILDADGTAWVELPDWFEALNRDFRYQLTCIGGYAPVYVAQEVANNRFQIAGGTSSLKVSWQVTGIRHDAYAEANRIPVEEDKPPQEQGAYLHPTEHGQPESARIPSPREAGEG